jgi:hypothetical protein
MASRNIDAQFYNVAAEMSGIGSISASLANITRKIS